LGFFKDMKNIRESAAERGGMPGFGDAERDISKLYDDRGEREILANGITAKAVVKGTAMPVQGDRFALQIPLEVHPPEGEPYPIDYVFPVVRMQAPLILGMEVPVKISADDPKHVAVQWDAEKAEIAAAGGGLAAAEAGFAGNYAETAKATMAQAMQQYQAGAATPAPPAPPVDADPKARLEKLDELKTAGLIDDAEYEAKKQQIIDAL
jgi:Short C-terminal domain